MRKYFAFIVVQWKRLREQGRLWRDLNMAENDNLELRYSISWRDKEIQALNKAVTNLQAKAHEPLAEAEQLLRLADELLSPGKHNAYEFRCWRDDYWQHVLRGRLNGAAKYFTPFDGPQ